MQIKFANIRDDRTRSEQFDVSFKEAETVRGDLEIALDGLDNPFRRSDVSVPLIVAETKLFFARLRRHGHATWRLFFAPFLDGRLEDDGAARLMEGSKDHVSGKVVERISPEDLDKVLAELDEFERQYGRLAPSEDAIQTPALGGG